MDSLDDAVYNMDSTDSETHSVGQRHRTETRRHIKCRTTMTNATNGPPQGRQLRNEYLYNTSQPPPEAGALVSLQSPRQPPYSPSVHGPRPEGFCDLPENKPFFDSPAPSDATHARDPLPEHPNKHGNINLGSHCDYRFLSKDGYRMDMLNSTMDKHCVAFLGQWSEETVRTLSNERVKTSKQLIELIKVNQNGEQEPIDAQTKETSPPGGRVKRGKVS